MGDELTIETVTALPVDQLTDDHKTFLKDNQDKLSDDQKKTYGGFFGNNDDDGGKDEDDIEFEDDGASPPDPDDKKDKKDKKDKDADDDDAGDDDDLDDDDKNVITKKAEEVAKNALAPILKANEEARVSKEWTKAVTDFPELKKFETKILRYANHSSYQGKSVMQSIIDVAGVDVFVKIGAKRAKSADDDSSRDNNNGGGSSRPNDGGGDKGVNNSGIGSFKGLSGAEIQKKITEMRKAGTYRER
jgi:hypothetical protein